MKNMIKILLLPALLLFIGQISPVNTLQKMYHRVLGRTPINAQFFIMLQKDCSVLSDYLKDVHTALREKNITEVFEITGTVRKTSAQRIEKAFDTIVNSIVDTASLTTMQEDNANLLALFKEQDNEEQLELLKKNLPTRALELLELHKQLVPIVAATAEANIQKGTKIEAYAKHFFNQIVKPIECTMNIVIGIALLEALSNNSNIFFRNTIKADIEIIKDQLAKADTVYKSLGNVSMFDTTKKSYLNAAKWGLIGGITLAATAYYIYNNKDSLSKNFAQYKDTALQYLSDTGKSVTSAFSNLFSSTTVGSNVFSDSISKLEEERKNLEIQQSKARSTVAKERLAKKIEQNSQAIQSKQLQLAHYEKQMSEIANLEAKDQQLALQLTKAHSTTNKNRLERLINENSTALKNKKSELSAFTTGDRIEPQVNIQKTPATVIVPATQTTEEIAQQQSKTTPEKKEQSLEQTPSAPEQTIVIEPKISAAATEELSSSTLLDPEEISQLQKEITERNIKIGRAEAENMVDTKYLKETNHVTWSLPYQKALRGVAKREKEIKELKEQNERDLAQLKTTEPQKNEQTIEEMPLISPEPAAQQMIKNAIQEPGAYNLSNKQNQDTRIFMDLGNIPSSTLATPQENIISQEPNVQQESTPQAERLEIIEPEPQPIVPQPSAQTNQPTIATPPSQAELTQIGTTQTSSIEENIALINGDIARAEKEALIIIQNMTGDPKEDSSLDKQLSSVSEQRRTLIERRKELTRELSSQNQK